MGMSKPVSGIRLMAQSPHEAAMMADRISQGDPRTSRESPRACSLVRRMGLAGPWLTMAAAVWMSACEDPCVTEPCRADDEPPGVVSNPVSSFAAAAAVTGSSGALASSAPSVLALAAPCRAGDRDRCGVATVGGAHGWA